MAEDYSSAKYLGEWELIPELCHYQANDPPVSGRYLIQLNTDQIDISIWWVDQSQSPFEIHFGGPIDGSKHSYDAPGVTHVMYEHIGECTLDSTAYRDDDIVLYARRIASNDGSLLTVSQATQLEGKGVTNFQVYRRIASK